jgi:flagellar biosynthesis protein FlhB
MILSSGTTSRSKDYQIYYVLDLLILIFFTGLAVILSHLQLLLTSLKHQTHGSIMSLQLLQTSIVSILISVLKKT